MAGRHSSDIPKRYTGARNATFARSARNNWIPKRDGYIHTYILEIRIRSRVPRAANVYRRGSRGGAEGAEAPP